jgi:O-methyltransferase
MALSLSPMNIIEFKNTIVKPHSMVETIGIDMLFRICEKVIVNNIEGDFVETGVWEGGLSAIFLRKIIKNNLNKKLYLYDTFEGMPEPTVIDVKTTEEMGFRAHREWINTKDYGKEFSDWCRASLDRVKDTLSQVTLDYEKHTFFIKGKVEDTLLDSKNLPDKISVLRLDTDWYTSTKIEMEVLYPKVVKNGYIIIDDYYHWRGCKKAVDEYLKSLPRNSYGKTKYYDKALVIKKLAIQGENDGTN